MSVDRTLRLNELFRRTISEAVPRVVGESELDVAALTVTRVVVSGDLHTARVMVSIRGHEAERARMMRRLRRFRPEFQEVVAREIVLKYTPRLIFELDTSLERGDHVLRLIEDLALPPANAEDAPPAAPDAGGTNDEEPPSC